MTRLTLIAALAIAAPMTAMAADSVDNTKYACDGNKVLDVVFLNTEAGNSYAVIHDMDELIAMKQVVTASGASYEPVSPDYKYRLDTDGSEATLTAITEGKEDVLYANCKG
ncbi:MliC family protein [Paracoccus sp. p4-l81]|uniref:MliC family protein n=1 Tax=unclassified Paracoccus (in: a-proteobacteria) TaxID=2688777 RepID=UPI0035B9A055